MTQAFGTSMTGMNAAQQQLTVVADNIANMNTTAFKESSINFQDVWYQTTTAGTSPSNNRGGVNPMQVGIGTMVGSITKNFAPNTINTTGRATDMCIQGNGFFTVMDAEGAVYYTRDGNFSLDPNGNLVTANGQKVMGAMASLSLQSSNVPVKIPPAIQGKAEAQLAAIFGGKTSAELNNAKISNGQFTITPIVGGVTQPEVTITVNNGMTMTAMAQDITNQLSAAGYKMSCEVKDGGFEFVLDGSGTGANVPDKCTFTAGTSNFVEQTKIAQTDPVNGAYQSKIMDYHIELNPVTSLTDANKFSTFEVSDDGVITAKYANGDSITVWTDPQDKSKLFKYTTSDGVEIMGPSDCQVNPNLLTPENLQIQFASVTNPEGLVAVGTNLYQEGPNSGDVFYTGASANGVGQCKAGGLEASNVDLSRQFSNMIMAQRAIEANSRVFDAANQIMQTLTYLGK